MNTSSELLTTGLPGLDRMLHGLQPGDNVVWEVDSINDYTPFVRPFWTQAVKQGRRLTYFHFARHHQLIPDQHGVEIYRLHPEAGFEKFLTEILDVIEKNGQGAFYVFDWLSDLVADWYSDRMLGNFFMITCPFLYDLETVAYFGLRKNQHSFHATDGINNTAQVILEVYRKSDQLFLHPLKVYQRHSPTLYMLHIWEGQEFRPVTSSAVLTEILAGIPQPWLDFTIHRPGVWVRTFRQAQETLDAVKSGRKPQQDAEAFFRRLLKMVITRDERFLGLAEKYFELVDVIEIMKRMIGTGLIGGKSLGMLLGRAILRKADSAWTDRLEVHDSFFVGSDVFYTYLVQNGCWWLRRRQKDFSAYLEKADEARKKMLEGVFPQYIQDQFMEMLEYFGQSPIIIRSSSLLEDNYGNAFSGKYESVFCANQGAPRERLEAFMRAVRTVYASTMSREGLLYRLHHGLLDQDEQMALLVQRVSGEMYGHLFFPQIAGVGFSFNPFVWHEHIDPAAGVLRLVLGLGTRAVERTEDDYTRLVGLNLPHKRLESNLSEVRQYSQRRVDVLDLNANQLKTIDFETTARVLPAALLDIFASNTDDLWRHGEANWPANSFQWTLTFDRLLTETTFADDMRALLSHLQAAYNHPVDIEFTANFVDNARYRINLVQCRPFQVKIKGEGSKVHFPRGLHADRVVLESGGPIVGQSLVTAVDRLIYVVPSVYGKMPLSQRYSIARTIGRLTHLPSDGDARTLMLVGPGRWGTSMPSLGVPVSFAEINTVSVLAEVAVMHEGLVPDVSLGTHFFNDLVEMDMLCLAIFPEKIGQSSERRSAYPSPQQVGGAAAWRRRVG
ncbi:MAG: PEP/pyruvate-binding domain-containing protein [Candidatus Omnitrophica bacterium]|nr:PEP/pyruvate-binding domain-containing protein [Candidatus Omnitrophota bacterium]